MGDPPEEWAGLFDFSNPGIQDWEVEAIRSAVRNNTIRFPDYALNRARYRSIDIPVIGEVILSGKPVEKDPIPTETRDQGISFEKTLRSGRRIKVKVGFLGSRYAVVTIHD